MTEHGRLQPRPQEQPPTNEELLEMAARFAERARDSYDSNEYARTAALISLAGSAVVIARMVATQTQLMTEANLPGASVPVKPPGVEGE